MLLVLDNDDTTKIFTGTTTLTCQIIVQQILLFFGKKTHTKPY